MIAVLAGGTGAAKFVRGLLEVILPETLALIGNTGDDVELWGLHISPDLDTLMYGLAGMLDEERGWGIRGDTFACLAAIGRFGEPTWFRLGDRDLATHLVRTKWLRQGYSLTEVTAALCARLGVRARLLPMTNDPVRTYIHTPSGVLAFQEFFVRERWMPEVVAVEYRGSERARPAPGVLEAIGEAQGILIAPSNPITSVGPILSIPGIREALARRRERVLAVSPIIGTEAVSGPAGKLMRACGYDVSPLGVARFYAGIIGRILIDEQDAHCREAIEQMGVRAFTAPLRMSDRAAAVRLAREALACLHSEA
ncbi:MAG: 2-phospho-L-lactate transferase [Acidobacteriota bacterium]|nr:2-phospho-L-lactate transferase [Blastocatellia bacterium]MDW8167861.1 2-phospho-L-lactate transferase [Acidobacteriota bacterium]MDW8255895.1 2-phospho-L-lactate transferase [Acidobacteriota bacterium]